MKLFFRKLHRWLGLAMALQIIAWMASGLYFAIFPIETIRGEHLTLPPDTPDAAGIEDLVTVGAAWGSVLAEVGADAKPVQISLLARDDTVYFRVSGTVGNADFVRLVNGNTARVEKRLDAVAASAIAEASLASPGRIEAVDLVQEVEPGSEIRGRQLPVWRVVLSEPESLRLYLDPWTGEIIARRTARWRIFDFLWMLHIMDFDERDDFNTALLQIAAALGLLVALSGVIFWFMTTKLIRRRRSVTA
jgi:uncharacterized iron-regulated membrane protein